VSLFLDNARRIFETAEAAPDNQSSDLTILIAWDGNVHILSEGDWPLDRLEVHRGAQAAYRVSRNGAGIRVEGRSGRHKCLLESEGPLSTPRRLPADQPLYCLASPPLRLLEATVASRQSA
jgi:hypothetical protein